MNIVKMKKNIMYIFIFFLFTQISNAMACMDIIKQKMEINSFGLKYYVSLSSYWDLHFTNESNQDADADKFFFKPLALLIDKFSRRGYYIKSCERGVLKIRDKFTIETENPIDSQMTKIYDRLIKLKEQKKLKEESFNGVTTYHLPDLNIYQHLEPIMCDSLSRGTFINVDSSVSLKLDETRSIKTSGIKIINVDYVFDMNVKPSQKIYLILKGHLTDQSTNKEYMITFYCEYGNGYSFEYSPSGVYNFVPNYSTTMFALDFGKNLKLINDKEKKIILVNNEYISDLQLKHTKFIKVSSEGREEVTKTMGSYIEDGYFLEEFIKPLLPKETSLSISRESRKDRSHHDGSKVLEIDHSRGNSSLVKVGSSAVTKVNDRELSLSREFSSLTLSDTTKKGIGHDTLEPLSELENPIDVDEKIFGYDIGSFQKGLYALSKDTVDQLRWERFNFKTLSHNYEIDRDKSVTSMSYLMVDDCRSLSGKTLFFTTNTYMRFSQYSLSTVPENENNELYMHGTVFDYDIEKQSIRTEYILSKCMSFNVVYDRYTVIKMYSYDKKTNDTREVLVVFKFRHSKYVGTIIFVNRPYKHQVITSQNFISKFKSLISLSKNINLQVKDQFLFNAKTLNFTTINVTNINFNVSSNDMIEGNVVFNGNFKFDLKMREIRDNYIDGYDIIFNIIDKDKVNVGELIVNIRDDNLVFFFKMDIDDIDLFSGYEMAKQAEEIFNENSKDPKWMKDMKEKVKLFISDSIAEEKPSQQIVQFSKSLELHVTNIPTVPCEVIKNLVVNVPHEKKIPHLEYTYLGNRIPIKKEDKKPIKFILLTILNSARIYQQGDYADTNIEKQKSYISSGHYGVKSKFTIFFEDNSQVTFNPSSCYYERDNDGYYIIRLTLIRGKFEGDLSITLATRNLKDDYGIHSIDIPLENKDKFILPEKKLSYR